MKYKCVEFTNKGRGMVATSTVEESEEIMKESPAVLAVRSPFKRHVCNHCFLFSQTPFSFLCEHCFEVYYCTPECKMNDNILHAEWNQCGAFASLEGILVKEQINTEIVTIVKYILSLHTKYKNALPHILLLYSDESKVYLTDQVNHRDIIFQLCREVLDKDISRDFVNTLVGIYQCNAFQICQHSGTWGDVIIGTGIYTLTAMINHSCVSNCTVEFDNKQSLKLSATSKVLENEELTISYLTGENGYDRRLKLKKMYFFECECSDCKKLTNEDYS